MILKSLLGVIVGSIITFLLNLLKFNIIPDMIDLYIPVFIGAMAAGLIATGRMWLIGLTVSFIDLLLTFIILWKMAIAVGSDPVNLFKTTIGFSEILKVACIILASVVGAYTGNFLKAFVVKKVKLRAI